MCVCEGALGIVCELDATLSYMHVHVGFLSIMHSMLKFFKFRVCKKCRSFIAS